MAHPNEDLLRRGYQAFAKGDADTLSGLFADDIVWHVPGRSPLAGEYRGREAVFGLFAKLAEMTGGTFKLDVHDVLAGDEHGVVLAVATAEREGKRLESRTTHVWHLRDGKATEFWSQAEDLYAADEFWS